ncbi:MAG: GSCFA domain-containing protein [Alistipes sp.]|nr:GSCFA domain-containing protein [Alistipes sp.]
MKFRTEIDITPWHKPIDYSHNIVSLGSCFATNIAERLSRYKFRVTASPTGILFNPASIASAVRDMVESRKATPEELIMHNDTYLSYRFHSLLAGNTPMEAVERMNEALERGRAALATADIIIITLGTAWVYRLNSMGEVVANCHKQPARMFRRELLSVDAIVEALEEILGHTSCRILLTLSPVRHIGEGLEDNSLSKSLLRVAIAEVQRRHGERVDYFPSYEIMMDDLRDYRFYGDDLVHPTPMAVDYIAERFFATAMSSDAKMVMSRVEEVVRAAEHRPTNPTSEAHRSFCRRQLEAIAELRNVDLSEERAYFERMLQINL